ncbi:MAG: recombinase family protein [Actinomycetota bacterium]
MKVAAYLRVSTDRQAEEGLGLEVQEQAIRKWAREHKHRIVGWHRDEGVSGSNGIDTRKALPEALSSIKNRDAAGLVVYRLDRLARDLIIQETLLAEIRRMGGNMFTTSAAEAGYLDDDPNDPSRKLIRQVLGAVNEYERSMVVMRLRSGRRRKAEKGGFAYGSPALGYRAVDGSLLDDAEEQKVVKRIAALHKTGLSIRAIAEILTSEGFQTKRGNARWHPTVVARIIARL